MKAIRKHYLGYVCAIILSTSSHADKSTTHELALIQLRGMETTLANFKKICGRYPLTEEGLVFLVKNLKPKVCPNYPSPGFIEGNKVPLNPWNKPFTYTSDGNSYKLHTVDNEGSKVESF